MDQRSSPPRRDIAHLASGFLMGAADIVPGVSGGTVALVLGVYQRLLAAISSVDAQLFRLLFERKFRAAAEHIDLRFLVALGAGIAVAVVSLAKVMHYLLENHLGFTYAAFSGLILASGVLVGRMCRPRSQQQAIACVAIGAVAAVAAYGIVSLGHREAPEGLGYTFFSGAIAICAMILPGVSGSYLLVMLGKYHEITGILKDLPKLAVSGSELATLAVFAAGCACGLLLFSRVLKWLLARYWTPTMAALCGFMIGSLKKIWPFQTDTTPEVEKFKDKVFELYWPETIDADVLICVGITVAAFVGVLAIDAIAKQRGSSPAEAGA